MVLELKSENYREGLKFVGNDVEDLYLKHDLTKEDSRSVKAYVNDGGIIVLWRDDTAIIKAKRKSDAQDLLMVVPKDSKFTFLVDSSFSSLVREYFPRKEEIFSINYVTRDLLKPVRGKKFDVVPLSEDRAEEITRYWQPYSRGNVEYVRSLIHDSAYTILDKGIPTAWGTVLLSGEGVDLTGMWYTRPEYRNQKRMKNIALKIAENTTIQGKSLRADIRVDNLPSLSVARELGFLQKGNFSRLEPLI